MIKIVLVAACDVRQAIGKDNGLPWRHRGDMRHFKKLTTGHTVVMGSKTFESMGSKCLPNRRNIVLSRNPGGVKRPEVPMGHSPVFSEKKSTEELVVVDSVIETLKQCEGEMLFVIGGQQIYELFLPHADEIQLSLLDLAVDKPDAFFPNISARSWLCFSNKRHPDGEVHEDDVAWNHLVFNRP
ncbi:dihydrofolate reductase [Xanthomonas phage vB_XciM_LucasX]|nr:dihydrofolate reductase [Xanthomonas phage vB_XciM_LucasX]